MNTAKPRCFFISGENGSLKATVEAIDGSGNTMRDSDGRAIFFKRSAPESFRNNIEQFALINGYTPVQDAILMDCHIVR